MNILKNFLLVVSIAMTAIQVCCDGMRERKQITVGGIPLPADLEHLMYHDGQISNLDGIEKYKELKSLTLDRNPVKTYENLAMLKSLQVLEISEQEISNTEPLGRIRGLKPMELQQVGIQDWSFIGKLSELESLYIECERINYLTLKHLSNLKHLYWLHNSTDKFPKLPEKLKSLILDTAAYQKNHKALLKKYPKIQILENKSPRPKQCAQ